MPQKKRLGAASLFSTTSLPKQAASQNVLKPETMWTGQITTDSTHALMTCYLRVGFILDLFWHISTHQTPDDEAADEKNRN